MQCLNCTYITDKLNEINRHQNQHKLRKNGSFKCFPCGLIFNNYRVFKVHQNRKHPSNQTNPNIPSNPAVQKTFFCKKCTYFFSYFYRNSRNGETSFLCLCWWANANGMYVWSIICEDHWTIDGTLLHL
jgi:hypothetical protein